MSVKVVMVYTEGDGCTYSADHNYPFEYESPEQALVDFEALFIAARKSNTDFTFIGMEFYPAMFMDGPAVYLPEFLTLDEWFTAKRIN